MQAAAVGELRKNDLGASQKGLYLSRSGHFFLFN